MSTEKQYRLGRPNDPSGKANRRLIAAAAAGALAWAGGVASAAQHAYTPTNTTTDLWSTGANWSSTPVSAADTRLTFVGDNTAVLPDGFVNVNTNDAADPFQLNILDLQGTGPAAGSAAVSINGALSTTALSLVANGAVNPVVNLNAIGPTLAYNVNMPVTLGANTLFTGTGTAAFNFNGGINGAGFTLTKGGPTVATSTSSNLNLGGASTLGSLAIGTQNLGGKVTVLPGGSLAVGSGPTSTVTIGLSPAGNLPYGGTLDVSAASSFTANVGNFFVNYTASGSPLNTSFGRLDLGASNTITASNEFRVGRSDNQPMSTGGIVTTATNGSTTLNTPSMTIGTGKSSGSFTLGAGSTLDLAGLNGGRTNLVVGSNTVGTSSNFAATLDASASGAVFNGHLGTVLIGNNAINGSTNGSVLLGGAAGNHLNASGTSATFGGVVTVGRSTGGTGSGNGTLTLGNLGATSAITSTNNGTAILLGQATVAPRANGTLNLNGGTLTINTTGSAIAGGANGTSNVNFNGTTIRSGASSTAWVTNVTNARVAEGGAIFDTNGFNATVPQALTHGGAAATDGGVTKLGPGTLTLGGASSYTGPTNLNAGRLDLTGSLTSNVNVTGGTTIGGEGSTTGSLTFSGASRLFFDPLTAGSLTANTVDASGAAVEVLATSSALGTGFVVLDAPGGIVGAPNTNFVFNNRGTIYLNGTSTQLLVDTVGAATLTWRGDDATSPTAWDVKTTDNWVNGATPDVFFSGDTVVFDDTAASFTVNIQPAAVSPAAVTFNNSATAYLVTGAAINATASLTKDGTNTVTISNDNTYTGGTTINAGTLQLGDGANAAGSLGSGPVTNNAVLVTNYGANNATLANAIGGTGTLTKNGSGTLTVTGANTFAGGTTIGAGTLQLAGGGTLGTGPVANNAALAASGTVTLSNDISGPGTLTNNGTGVVTLTGNNTYAGGTTINAGGTIQVGDGNTTGSLGSGPASNSGALRLNRSDNFSVAGAVTGPGSISKLGAGTATLAAAANTAGSIDVGTNTAGGTLVVPAGGSLAVGNGGVGTLGIGISNTATAATGTLDASAAASFTADVSTITIGGTGNSNVTAAGTLNLPSNSSLTATTSIIVGDSGGARNGDNGVPTQFLTTAPGGTTTVRTPFLLIGGSKTSASFMLGAGNTLDVGGIAPARAAFSVGDMFVGGGGGNYASTADVSAGVVNATLSSLFVGNQNTANSTSNLAGTLTIGTSAANHLDVSGPGSPVVVGRQQVATATGVATGTLTIGNLDATSAVTSTDNGTAILVAGAIDPSKAAGTLNLDGGTLTVNTSGAAIAGGGGTSTVNFNGTTLRPGASSAGWIQNLTTANVQPGGAKFDTNGFDVAVPQPLVHAAALGATPDGGVTKSGAGTLTLTGGNTYTGGTNVQAGTLRVTRMHENNPVNITGGKLQVIDSSPTLPNHPSGDNAFVSRPSALTIADNGGALGSRTYNGQLDLGNNDLILDYDGTSPIADIEDMVRAGYNGGNWLGNGIASSTANANSNFAVGVADNARLTNKYDGTRLFSGQAVDETTILVKFTHRIDLDLDGVITTNDATIFNSNYTEGQPAYWSIGDVDYDRVFTTNDATLFNSFYSEALASVPEPAASVLSGLGVVALIRRRRRTHD